MKTILMILIQILILIKLWNKKIKTQIMIIKIRAMLIKIIIKLIQEIKIKIL